MLNSASISRRNLLQLGGTLASTSLFSPGLARSSTTEWASGTVYEARSPSFERQADDPGIQGVLVSNGIDVTRTDDEGRYRLPISDGTTIFLIKPKGWSVPLDPETKLPRHFYTHQPAGSPVTLQYPGLSPTGPRPAQIDFPLRRAVEPATYSVLMLADPQPNDRKELEFLRQMIVSKVADGHAFALTLGDLMSDDLSLYEPYNRLMGQLALPMWNVPGNHDLNQDAPHPRFTRETWKRVFGPTHQAFEYGNAVFILLDNISTERVASSKHKYRGEIGRIQLAFVHNLLAHVPDDRLIVLAMHIPLVSALDPSDPSSNTCDTAELLALMGDRPCVSFSGHMHTTEHHYLGAEQGCRALRPHHHHVLTAASGSWWSGPFDAVGLPTAQSMDGTPNGFHVLEIDGSDYRTRFVPAREQNQLRIMLATAGADRASDCRLVDGAIAECDLNETSLLVNVFDGGPRTRVSCQFDQRAPMEMSGVSRSDPTTAGLYAQAGETLKPWVKAEPSSHIWQMSLPADLAPGLHKATVTARDPFGRLFSQKIIFEVRA